jgi:hypothetical protein
VTITVVGLVGFAVDVVVVGAVEDGDCSSQEPTIQVNVCYSKSNHNSCFVSRDKNS